jgi:hypothetical protein
VSEVKGDGYMKRFHATETNRWKKLQQEAACGDTRAQEILVHTDVPLAEDQSLAKAVTSACARWRRISSRGKWHIVLRNTHYYLCGTYAADSPHEQFTETNEIPPEACRRCLRKWEEVMERQ